MTHARILEADFLHLRDERKALHLSRFFKTAPGEYGEGDRFLGICNPEIRRFVKERTPVMTLDDVEYLVASEWHEIRVAGFLILVNLYQKQAKTERRALKRGKPLDDSVTALTAKDYVDSYLMLLDRGNNWDLVDLVAPKILGDRLTDHPEENGILFELADMEGHLWHQRVAMVSTWTLIRAGRFAEAMQLANLFLNHKHDLMHKATGWMLREVGKRGGLALLLDFLDCHAAYMPRTMLRYAIERFPQQQRQHYMHR